MHALIAAVALALPPAVPAAPATAPAAAVPSRASQPETGERIARITIARMKVRGPVREGVTRRVLARGIGHYPGTAMPGETGNAVLLAHRTTFRAPFARIGRMRASDRITVKAGGRTFVYRAYGKRVISPRRTSVLAPVPFRWGATPREAVLTLVSCHPPGSDRARLVVLARLEPGRGAW
ncbi:class E sortase [Spirillospora sp. NPDC029432]|uniref:class E sortase n=1 Tax=Spirillospora sp. NPDC029432 TaxID=3154599 RepID=UPI003452FB68